MITYKPGDILLVPFPFTDFTTLKQRPCVVLSVSSFNLTHDNIIVAAITSQVPDKISTDEYLLNAKEQIAGGLPKISLIRLGKIATI